MVDNILKSQRPAAGSGEGKKVRKTNGKWGRPKVDPVKKHYPHKVTMTDEDWKRVRAYCHLHGHTVSSFLRACSFQPRRKTKELSSDSRALLVELGRVGNNLNQLAHAANASAKTGKANVELLQIVDIFQKSYCLLSDMKGQVFRDWQDN